MTHRVLLLACLLMALSTAGGGQEAGPVGPSVEAGQEIGKEDIQPTLEGDAVKEHHEGINPSGPSNQQNGPKESIAIESNAAVDIKSVEPVDEDQWNENGADPSEEVDRERRDLHAQESMASSATFMVYVTIASTALTAFALVFIRLTYLQTRRAADYTEQMLASAIETANAAKEQVTITKEVGEIQARAFVDVTFARLRFDRGKISLSIKSQNFGSSPAFSIKYIVVFRADYSDPTIVETCTDLPSETAFGYRTLAAGEYEETIIPVSTQSEYSGDIWRKSDGPIRQIDVLIEYKTAFDRQRRTFDRESSVCLRRTPDERGVYDDPAPSRGVSFPLEISSPYNGSWMHRYEVYGREAHGA